MNVVSTMLAFFSVLSLTSLPEKIREKEVQSLISMTRWVLTTWSSRSWSTLVSEVKAISLFARQRSLGVQPQRTCSRLLRRFGFGNSRVELAQVATLSRALPPALVGQCNKALADHRVALESINEASVTSPLILNEIRAFARTFARKFRPSEPLMRPWLGPGSCLESSRAEGGQLGALAKWEEEWQSQELPEALKRLSFDTLDAHDRAVLLGPPPDETAAVVAEALYRDSEKFASLVSFPIGTKFRCRRVVVKEAGCKARVVTCHPIAEVALGQYLRMMAYGALKRFPATAAVLRGDVLGSLKEVFEGQVVRGVYSGDLTNATDYLHQDAAIEMCRTVFEVWGLPQSLLDRIPSLLGPHEFDGWSSSRGILMGGPLSWFVLCLMNTFCALRGRPLKEALRFFRVCGDDLIANFTKAESEAYMKYCGSVGFHVNRTKSFYAQDSGVFAERVFKLRVHTETEDDPFPPIGGPVLVQVKVTKKVDPLPVIPAKVFRLSISRHLCWHSIGPTLTSALSGVRAKDRHRALKRVRRLTGMLRPNLAHDLYRAGIDAAAPRILGGGELPWITRFTSKSRRLASILASKDLPLRALKEADGELLLASDLGGAYQLESSAEGADLIRGCALGDIPPSRVIWYEGGLPKDHVPVIGNWAEIVRDAEALHGRMLRSWGVVPVSKRDLLRLSIASVARDLKRRQAKLIAVYPTAPLTSHLYESLKKRFRLEDLFALPYRDDLVVTHDAGGESERRVPCGADVRCNRRFYRKLLPAFFTQRDGVGISQT